MTKYQRTRRRSDLLTRFVVRWFLLFSSLTASLLVSGLIGFAGLRAYWLWSVKETKQEVDAAVKKEFSPPTNLGAAGN